MTAVRVSLGRTINLGNFESLRVDVAHEVTVVDGARDAAIAEAITLCRRDLATFAEAELTLHPALSRRMADATAEARAEAAEALARELKVREQARHLRNAVEGLLRDLRAGVSPKLAEVEQVLAEGAPRRGGDDGTIPF